MDSKQLAAAAAHLADEKKGQDIRVYDVGDQIKVADWFVVISAPSRPHVKAITQGAHTDRKARRYSGLCCLLFEQVNGTVVEAVEQRTRQQAGLLSVVALVNFDRQSSFVIVSSSQLQPGATTLK